MTNTKDKKVKYESSGIRDFECGCRETHNHGNDILCETHQQNFNAIKRYDMCTLCKQLFNVRDDGIVDKMLAHSNYTGHVTFHPVILAEQTI